MKRQLAAGSSPLLVFVVALVGCAGRGGATPAPTRVVLSSSATTVPAPPATSSMSTETPTGASKPLPSPMPEATPIEFSAGMTHITLSGELLSRAVAHYVLGAQAGQLMEVSLIAREEIQLSIIGSDGTVLKSAEGTPFFRGTLPSSQDYLLVLTAGDQAVSYTMSVVIPERIQFSTGATSAAVEGQLPARSTHYYVLSAEAGQLMEVNVPSHDGVQAVIYGMDGTVLKTGMGEGSFFRGTLPSSQEYVIALSAGDQAVSYTMNVIIARRIEFAPGATFAVEQGEVWPGREQAWVLAASAGQELKVDVAAPGADVRLVVYGEDGSVLKSGMGGGSTFEGTLPSTQDYIVVVGPADRSTSYQLEVTIL